MFNFFKKSKSDLIKENFSGFQDGFSKEQKVAIIGSLIIIAKADGQVHPNEMQQIKQTAEILGIRLDDPIFAKSVQGGKDLMIKTLSTLNQNQKEWFVVTTHGIASADGKIEDIEIKYVLGICEEMGISEERYIEIIQKAQLLMKKFI